MCLRSADSSICTALVLSYCWVCQVHAAAADSKPRHAPEKPPAYSFVVSGQYWHQNHADAWDDAVNVAHSQVSTLWRSWRPDLLWRPPLQYVEQRLVKEEVKDGVETEKSFSSGVGPMSKVHLRIEIDQRSYREMVKAARKAIVEQRLTATSYVLAGIVAFLTLVSAYLHVNEWTKGYLTSWLRLSLVVGILGALFLIRGGSWARLGAAGLVFLGISGAAFLALAMIKSRHKLGKDAR